LKLQQILINSDSPSEDKLPKTTNLCSSVLHRDNETDNCNDIHCFLYTPRTWHGGHRQFFVCVLFTWFMLKLYRSSNIVVVYGFREKIHNRMSRYKTQKILNISFFIRRNFVITSQTFIQQLRASI